jgi:hypothetical protein
MPITEAFYLLVFDEFNVPTKNLANLPPGGIIDVAPDGDKMANIRQYRCTIDTCDLAAAIGGGIVLLDKSISQVFLGQGTNYVHPAAIIPRNSLALQRVEVTEFDGRSRLVVLLAKMFADLTLAAGGTKQFVTGTTDGSGGTVTDASLAMSIGEFVGAKLRRIGSPGPVEERTITANTATVFTLDSGFSAAPGNTEFVVILTGDLPDAAGVAICVFQQGETGKPQVFIGDDTAALANPVVVPIGGAQIEFADLCNFIAAKTDQAFFTTLNELTIVEMDAVDVSGRSVVMIVAQRNSGLLPALP